MKKKPNPHAVALGKLGRAKNSPAQQEASRKNGAKKGREARLLKELKKIFEPVATVGGVAYTSTPMDWDRLYAQKPRRHTRAEVKCGQGVAKARKGDV